MSSIVLVTGGSGFVGQHVIGLLQKRASHVTEIRNLDLNPFENTLGTLFELLHEGFPTRSDTQGLVQS